MEISKLKDERTGKQKYPNLFKLALVCSFFLVEILILSGGFEVHGAAIQEDTIIALRLVKDQIIKKGGVMNIQITKDLVKKCQDSTQKIQRLPVS